MGFFKSIMSVISTDGKTGTPFKLDKNHTVYYKGDGVTKLDAAHVAGFYKGYGYFTEKNQSDIQIMSNKMTDPIRVGYIIGVKDISPGGLRLSSTGSANNNKQIIAQFHARFTPQTYHAPVEFGTLF